MTPERWAKISEVLDQLFQLDEVEWQHYLERLRQRDVHLSEDIEALMAPDPKQAELETPPDQLMNLLRSQKDNASRWETIGEVVRRTKTQNLITEAASNTGRAAHRGTQPFQRDSEDMPERAGRFLVRREIARGGMGVIVQAHDPSIQRELALKIISPIAQGIPNADARFLREARITGQLQHPGIPPIHELGHLEDGRPFFAMKLIRGETLANLLNERRDTRSDLPQMLDIFEQICQAIAFAHSKRIIHRDLKPSNIMVGSFGQVQVMDWGLAKSIRDDPISDVAGADPGASTLTELDDLTLHGNALGTPAYMAPEQARGEGEPLDERCDVFGLGGILCVMLTGAPPCPKSSIAKRREMTGSDDLNSTFEQLDQCGADSELIELAKKCLAVDKSDRFDDASQVAQSVTRFRQQVQQRLKTAELDREKSQIQLLEERKRLRVSRAFTFSLVVLALTLAGVGVAIQQSYANRKFRAERLNESVGSTLDAVENDRQRLHERLADSSEIWPLLSDLRDWDTRVQRLASRVSQARELADSNSSLLKTSERQRLESLEASLDRDKHDFELVCRLQSIRLETSSPYGGLYDPSSEGPLFAAAFAREGFDIEHVDPAGNAARIRQSPIRYALVAALDQWANATDTRELLVVLLETARLADDDPMRNRIRTIEVWEDRETLEVLAKEIDPARQSPHLLGTLAVRLDTLGADSTALFHRALMQYPDDFLLHFSLGNIHRDPRDAEAEFRAALAIRPGSSVVFNNLGIAKYRQGNFESAREHLLRSLDIDPDFAQAHHNLGVILEDNNDFAGSIKHFQRVLDVVPDNASSHFHLGFGLVRLGKIDEGILHYEQAIQSDPTHARAQTNLAYAKMSNGDVEDAIEHFQMAVSIDPGLFEPHIGLGNAYLSLHQHDLAIEHYRMAADLNPKNVTARNNLGFALLSTGDATAALEHFRAAIKLAPNHASAYFNLGNALSETGNGSEAIEQFRKAIEINPDYAEAWCNLGHELRAANELVEALEALERGHQLGSKRPNWRYPSASWIEHCKQLLDKKEETDGGK